MNQIEPVQVSLADDGFVPPPAIMAEQLLELTKSRNVEPDYYGNGGAVEELETALASHLGKERAVMFPTGTLANLIAMQCLTRGQANRIIVHRDSHLYNDSGDNLARLGGFTMVPLGGADASYSAAEVRRELERASSARVESQIGCIAIETPNRRHFGGRFDQDDLSEITAVAAEHQVPLFLDGARMLIECAYSGRAPSVMAEPFQIVYVSLYKYLGAPFGCVLAGGAELLDGVFHERRRFGGSLYQAWPAAVLASNCLSGFSAKWEQVIPASEAVLTMLNERGDVRVETVPNGTNIALFSIPGGQINGEKLKHSGSSRGLKMPAPVSNRVPVKINETWLNLPLTDLADRISATMKVAAGS